MRRHHHNNGPSQSISHQTFHHSNHLNANQSNLVSCTQTQPINQKFNLDEKNSSVFNVNLSEGFLDSLRIQVILDSLKSNPDLRSKIFQNSFLQLTLMASMIGFQSFSEKKNYSWSTLDFFFNLFWLLPIMFISIILNNSISDKMNSKSIYTEDQEQTIYQMIKLKKTIQINKKLKKLIQLNYHKVLILLNYFLMSKGLLYFIPINIMGTFSSFCFCSIANSFYCFEQAWSKEGLNFEQRLDLLEKRWDYHLGFGLLITILVSIYPHHLVINLSIFTFFFPFLLILSTPKSNHEKLNYLTTTTNNDNMNPSIKIRKNEGSYYHHSRKLPILFISRALNFIILKFTSIQQSNLGINTHDFTCIEDGRNQ